MTQPLFRHFGKYRTGVTATQAALDRKVLTVLYRRGSMTEARLLDFISTEPDILSVALDRLAGIDNGLVTWARSTPEGRYVSLTGTGQFWAEETIATEDGVKL